MTREGLAQSYIDEFKPFIVDLEADFIYLEEQNLLRKIGGKYLITDSGLLKLTNKPDNREVILAEEMMDIFPKGKKAGNWYWRGTKSSVAEKLRKLLKKHPQYTNDEIIKATKNYVESFYGKDIHMAMSVLIYFIEKDGRSILIEYLESLHTEEVDKYDWTKLNV